MGMYINLSALSYPFRSLNLKKIASFCEVAPHQNLGNNFLIQIDEQTVTKTKLNYRIASLLKACLFYLSKIYEN